MRVRRLSAVTLAAAAGAISLTPDGLCATGGPIARADGGAGQLGTLTIELDRRSLGALGWTVHADGADEQSGYAGRIVFPIRAGTGFESDGVTVMPSGSCRATGALLIEGPPERIVVGNLEVSVGADGEWAVSDTLNGSVDGEEVFVMPAVMVDVMRATREIRIVGELSIAESWARRNGHVEVAGMSVGVVTIDATLPDGWTQTEGPAPPARDVEPTTSGPDIVVADLQGVVRLGWLDGISAYGIGTTACNYGDERANWVNSSNEHPVIAQAIYRLKDDRFEQIGMSWVKHGFYALSEDFCGLGCPDPTMGQQLGVGCSDPYTAALNAAQNNLALRSDVNAHTGSFPYPWSAPPWETVLDRRIQVRNADLRPSENVGAQYFLEGQYIAADDAAAGNGNNNATYRRAIVTQLQPAWFDVQPDPAAASQIGQPAIRAWQDADPAVVETDIQVPDDGLLILAGKAIALDDGFWRYEYAVQNLNSDRCAGSLTIPVAAGATVRLTGFADTDYHSGEIFDSTDWAVTVTPDAVTWFTESESADPLANALRFGTLYNFWLETDAEPKPTIATIGLFKAGTPPEVRAVTIGSVGLPGPMCDGSFDIDRSVRSCVSDGDCLEGLAAQSQVDCVMPPGGMETTGTCYVRRNRYVSIDPNPAHDGIMTARRVSIDMGDGTFRPIGWVGEPMEVEVAGPEVSPQLLSRLQDTPHYRYWSLDNHDVPWVDATVHVGDCEISPGNRYRIDSIAASFDLGDEANYSVGLLLTTTSHWADVVGARRWEPPDGSRSFRDVTATIAGFRGAQQVPSAWLDLEGDPATPEQPRFDDIGFNDISHAVAGYQGAVYPFAAPCDCPRQPCR